MDRTLPEGAVIGLDAFLIKPIDGSRGACLFGTVAAALGDGSTPEGIRAVVAAFIRSWPHALVRFGDQLWRVSDLTKLMANVAPHTYARELERAGVWGDSIALAIAAHLHGVLCHIMLPRGGDDVLTCALLCGPRDGQPVFTRHAHSHYDRDGGANAGRPLRRNAKARRLARRAYDCATLEAAAPYELWRGGLELLQDYASDSDGE